MSDDLNQPHACLSAFALDEFLAGECDPALMRQAETHLAGCARCAARREAVVAEQAAFAVRALPPALAAASAAPVVVPLRRRRLLGGALTTLAAAAAVLLLVSTRDEEPPSLPADRIVSTAAATGSLADPDVRAKGSRRLGVYVRRGERVSRGGTDERIAPGDAVQLTVTSPEPRYLVLFGVDGLDSVHTYFPEGSVAAPIAAGHDVPVPISIVFDASPGPERLWALFCSEPVLVAPIERSLRLRPDAPPDSPGCEAEHISLEKDVSRR
jgi:hypothetical protein